jgi:hypothetical protein
MELPPEIWREIVNIARPKMAYILNMTERVSDKDRAKRIKDKILPKLEKGEPFWIEVWTDVYNPYIRIMTRKSVVKLFTLKKIEESFIGYSLLGIYDQCTRDVSISFQQILRIESYKFEPIDFITDTVLLDTVFLDKKAANRTIEKYKKNYDCFNYKIKEHVIQY